MDFGFWIVRLLEEESEAQLKTKPIELAKQALAKKPCMTVQELLNAAQQLSLPDQIRLVSQLMQLVAQSMQSMSADTHSTNPSEDPLIGLFSGSPELATQSENILQQELNSTSGFSWKE